MKNQMNGLFCIYPSMSKPILQCYASLMKQEAQYITKIDCAVPCITT